MRLIILTVLLTLNLAHAQWSTDPSNNLIVGYGLLPELASDRAGGCYITYEQNTTYPRRLILERLNRYGFKPWGTGKQITGLFPEQSGAKIVEDGQNGVIVSYMDIEVTGTPKSPVVTERLRVQRVDSSGNVLWGANGVRVSLSETNQYDEEIVTDGYNGCFVAWYDTMNQLRLQRLNSLGERQLSDSGILIDASNSQDALMISDGLGGSILYVNDANGARYRRLDSNGTTLWVSNGGSSVGLGALSIASDGDGGAVFAGARGISYNNGDPYYAVIAQKIDSSGTIMWGTQGIIIKDSVQNVVNFLNPPQIRIERNIGCGLTVVWSTRFTPNKLKSYLQRIWSDGSLVYSDTLLALSGCDTSRNTPISIVTSENDSKLVTFADQRTSYSIYAQRFDSTGIKQWDSNDVLISSRLIDVLKAITDGNGGTILVGFGQADFTIQAVQCNRNGAVGEVITDVQEHNANFPPNSFTLYQNYPNPFNPLTTIQYQLATSAHVQLKVYNVFGQLVATLVDEKQGAGEKAIQFDASNVPSGVYFYKLQTDRYTAVKKMILLR